MRKHEDATEKALRDEKGEKHKEAERFEVICIEESGRPDVYEIRVTFKKDAEKQKAASKAGKAFGYTEPEKFIRVGEEEALKFIKTLL